MRGPASPASQSQALFLVTPPPPGVRQWRCPGNPYALRLYQGSPRMKAWTFLADWAHGFVSSLIPSLLGSFRPCQVWEHLGPYHRSH
ncbi:rCG34096 [Rattus norvegicus]|uniref:RCG34096 n=1 Tax=Rattus norvegicus TaxID=10116 RepID=A6HDQ7_RAT|nr:rCG34096 [Rattus norvegicus]